MGASRPLRYDKVTMISATALPHTRTTAPTRKVRVLIADDSWLARQAIVAHLRTLDDVDVYAVCENGRLAVETALRQEPDVVLLDLQMPVMGGLEATEIFRNSMPQVGVILTSVHDHLEVRETCLAGGADAFIGKGSIPAHFASVLEGVMTLTTAPERHRRGARLATRTLVDLFPPPLSQMRAGAHTPVGKPGHGPAASGSAHD